MRYPPFPSERTQTLPGGHKKEMCPMEFKNFQSGLNKLIYSVEGLHKSEVIN